jgi:hypothetical protein
MGSQLSDDGPQSAWATLGAVEQAKEWEAFRPGTFQEMFEFVKFASEAKRHSEELAAQHERRLDYIAVMVQVLALVFGLTTVLVLALVAKYYADHNAAADGAKIFGFGAGSIVAAFVGINVTPFLRRVNRGLTRQVEDKSRPQPGRPGS